MIMMMMMMIMMRLNGRWSATGFGAAAAAASVGDLGKLGANEPIVVQSRRAAQDYYYYYYYYHHYLCYYYYSLYSQTVQWCVGFVLYYTADPCGGCGGGMRFTIDVKRLYALSRYYIGIIKLYNGRLLHCYYCLFNSN